MHDFGISFYQKSYPFCLPSWFHAERFRTSLNIAQVLALENVSINNGIAITFRYSISIGMKIIGCVVI